MTVAILAVAPVTGLLTARLALRVPLAAGLLLFAVAAALMVGVEVDDSWTAVLPEMVLAGMAVGFISPALAATMVAVLPIESSGRSSGINNTFRQLGIAVGIAGLGALFDHHAGTSPGGVVDGLNAVLVVSRGRRARDRAGRLGPARRPARFGCRIGSHPCPIRRRRTSAPPPSSASRSWRRSARALPPSRAT